MKRQPTQSELVDSLKQRAERLGLVDGSSEWKSYVFGTLNSMHKRQKKRTEKLVQPKGQKRPA